ncbi:hypothetical protein GCM10009741_03630 [Kribbella lupini]|uniref:Uncharacterized protein n=1 Tax=Kribbella lupini TaxID=291602 RepID=A0ABN2A2C5_9ACTN
MLRSSVAASNGIAPSNPARPKSAPTINRRRLPRSTHTPTASPSTSCGTTRNAASTPISPAEAPNPTTATNGNATPDTADPAAETPIPTHNFPNSGLRGHPIPEPCRRLAPSTTLVHPERTDFTFSRGRDRTGRNRRRQSLGVACRYRS